MDEISRIVIPVGKKSKVLPPRSLTWQGDKLVDWVGGGNSYRLDGSMEPSRVNYTYRFDHAVTSSNGEYIALIERLGTKGLLLKNGEFIREINRSYYCADCYEYPLTFLTLPDGQTGIAHCPEEYCKLEIEEVESGKRPTQRTSEPEDFFHSRLSVSSDNRYLASAGWVWHPFEAVNVYSIEEVLEKPETLDGGQWEQSSSGDPVNMAILTGESSLIFTSLDETRSPLSGTIGVYNTSTQQILSETIIEECAGVIIPFNSETVLGVYQHLKLIDVPTGKVIARWEDLQGGEQLSCITRQFDPYPLVAVDAANRRFAVASAEAITVIQLG